MIHWGGSDNAPTPAVTSIATTAPSLVVQSFGMHGRVSRPRVGYNLRQREGSRLPPLTPPHDRQAPASLPRRHPWLSSLSACTEEYLALGWGTICASGRAPASLHLRPRTTHTLMGHDLTRVGFNPTAVNASLPGTSGKPSPRGTPLAIFSFRRHAQPARAAEKPVDPCLRGPGGSSGSGTRTLQRTTCAEKRPGRRTQ